MRQNFLAAVLALVACAAVSFAQTQAGARANNSTSLSRQGRQLDLASGTRVTGELQNTLDASKARVGDRVVLKTTEAIKSNGQTVVKKGATLVGHVADVQQRARGSAASSVTVIFDQLQSGSLSTPITATIDSITQGSAHARASNEDMGMDSDMGSRTTAHSSSSSSSGGLLGGATGVVGNTVGGVTGAAGDVVNSTTGTVGNTVGGTTRGLGQTLGQIQISQSASGSADGGSTLSLTGGNLRLEKGVEFHLTLNESSRVGNNQ